MRIDSHDSYRKLGSSKFMIALNGLDSWLRGHLDIAPMLYGIKNGVTELLLEDELVILSFVDGTAIQVNSVEELMSNLTSDVYEIRTATRTIDPDEYSILTDVLPDNILSLTVLGAMLIFNTLDNSIDRSIYFRGVNYTQEIYPMHFEDVTTTEELLGITMVDLVRTYIDHTSFTPDNIINANLRNHNNFSMLRYYVQTIMSEIRKVQAGIDAPDTMWEIIIKEGELFIVYMGNPHMYRLMASQMYLQTEEIDEQEEENKREARLHGIIFNKNT